MKAWLDWVTCFSLHFTLAYIVYRESRTHQVVYIYVHYGVHGEMYIGIDRILVAKPALLLSCQPNERQSAVFPPQSTATAPRWLENSPNEGTI